MELGLGLGLARRAGGFAPTSIAGLALWLDASDASTITESAGDVSQWRDKSANELHVNQSTPSEKPQTGVSTLNGNNVLTSTTFTTMNAGANYFYSSTGVEIFVVCKPLDDLNGDLSFLYDFGSVSGAGYGLSLSTAAGRIYSPTSSGGVSSTFTRTETGTQPVLVHGSIDLVDDVQQADVNGVQQVTAAIASLTGLTATEIAESGNAAAGSSPITIFSQGKTGSQTSRYFRGDIAEIVVYATNLTEAERTRVKSYLNTKWDLAFSEPLTLLGTTFSETSTAIPVRISESNYVPPVTWDGQGHFTLEDGTIPKQRVNTVPVLQTDGHWTWFCRPEAVYRGGFTFVGWTGEAGNWFIGRYEHSTGLWTTKD